MQSVKQALYAIFQMMKTERSLCIYLMYLDVSRCFISWIRRAREKVKGCLKILNQHTAPHLICIR